MLTLFCPRCYAENRAEDEVCRSCGARLDEEMGDYVERLIHFSLRHPVPSVPPMAARLRAVAALGKIGGDEAVGTLEDVAANDPSPGVRGEAQGMLRERRQVDD